MPSDFQLSHRIVSIFCLSRNLPLISAGLVRLNLVSVFAQNLLTLAVLKEAVYLTDELISGQDFPTSLQSFPSCARSSKAGSRMV